MGGFYKMVLKSFVKEFLINNEVFIVKSFTIYRSFSVGVPTVN